MTEYSRGKGGGHQKGEQVGYTVGLGPGHGAFQTILMLVTEKHVIWGQWACWSSGGLKSSTLFFF